MSNIALTLSEISIDVTDDTVAIAARGHRVTSRRYGVTDGDMPSVRGTRALDPRFSRLPTELAQALHDGQFPRAANGTVYWGDVTEVARRTERAVCAAMREHPLCPDRDPAMVAAVRAEELEAR
jgi:hypothetical protein